MDMDKQVLRLVIWPSKRFGGTHILPLLKHLSCPVCGVNLADIGSAPLQEAHVKNCLEGGTGSSPQSAKYLVYKLPEESALIGTECKT